MKTILACIVLCSFINIALGQDPGYSYFEIINKAEKCYYEKDYKDARMNYKSAFKLYNSPRGNDYYNAALVSIFVNNEDEAYIYFKEAVKRGYSINFINNPVVQSQIKDKKKWELFELEYDSLHNIYTEHLKSPVHKELFNMEREDQLLTNKIYFNTELQPQLDSLYAKNMYRIVSLIEKDSLPRVESYNMESRKLQSILPLIILRHYFGMLNRAVFNPGDYQSPFYLGVLEKNKLVENKLQELVRTGKLSPFIISQSITYNNPNELFGSLGENYCRYIVTKNDEYIMVEYVTTMNDYTQNELDSININRRKWFMPEFDDALKFTQDKGQLSDSVRKTLNNHFNYSGKITIKGNYLSDSDSIQFVEDCTKNLIGKFGYKLDWVYLGVENGWRLPKEYLYKKKNAAKKEE